MANQEKVTATKRYTQIVIGILTLSISRV